MDIVYSTQGGVNTPAISSGATALAANPKRIAWTIQNLGTNTLYVLMGSGASTTVFHVALPGGLSNDDGNGAAFLDAEGTVYSGIVTIAGTSPRYTVTEIAP